MSEKAFDLIRKAVDFAKEKQIKITYDGSWFNYREDKYISCCPIFSVFLMLKRFPKEFNPKSLDSLSRPGLLKLACQLLEVNHFWLYRFWMGYDSGYQIVVLSEDKNGKIIKTSKDDISQFGIKLKKEILKWYQNGQK